MPKIIPAIGKQIPAIGKQSVTDQMTQVYVFVDDYLKSHPALAKWRRSPNATPVFTDAEVITIALLQGTFQCATLKHTYQMVAANWRSAFPHLCTYSQWIARLHALAALVGHLIQAALGQCHLPGRLYIVDGLPIPVCKPIRHGRVRLLHEEGAYFGKSSIGWYFGFTLHTLIHHSGTILSAVLTPANWDEHDPALALALSVDGGVVLGDLGYRSQGDALAHTLAEEAELLLIHPADAGKKTDPRRVLVSSLRARIETSFSSLCRRFADRVYSRSWQGLWSSLKLKMLHFNLCQAGLLPA
jgi:IS5 family transposase